MNAKFEKWFSGSHLICKGDAVKTWNAAIQSLEVTPELVELACEAYDDDNLAGEEYSNTPGMQAALHAFLSALKEQAE